MSLYNSRFTTVDSLRTLCCPGFKNFTSPSPQPAQKGIVQLPFPQPSLGANADSGITATLTLVRYPVATPPSYIASHSYWSPGTG